MDHSMTINISFRRNLSGAITSEVHENGQNGETRSPAEMPKPGVDPGQSIGEAELVLRAETLVEARGMVDGIAGLLSLLRSLDRMNPEEPDAAQFDEIAALFSDIADFAAYAARMVRRTADAVRQRPGQGQA
jgi:hypothetical protein